MIIRGHRLLSKTSLKAVKKQIVWGLNWQELREFAAMDEKKETENNVIPAVSNPNSAKSDVLPCGMIIEI